MNNVSRHDKTDKKRSAFFVDRDGTLIRDAHYLSNPDDVKLIPGATSAMQRVNASGHPLVIVTNQSGIARGLISEDQYKAVEARTVELLKQDEVEVLATYHCPHAAVIPPVCDCRKPGLGLYNQAASDYNLSLKDSAYIGDRWRDVLPAIETGGIGILVPSSETPAQDTEFARSSHVQRVFLAESLGEAVSVALALMGSTDSEDSSFSIEL